MGFRRGRDRGGRAAANIVKVKGRVLPRVTRLDPGSMPMGWKVEPAGNQLVIPLPSHQVEHSERTARIEVDFNTRNRGRT